MLKPELENLITTSLESLGAEEVERTDGVVRYRLTDGLATRFGRRELVLTFASGVAAQRDDVELVSAGSFMYDLILRLVRERGRAASGWLPADPAVDPEAVISRTAQRLADRAFTRLKSTWGTGYLFSYRLGFYFDTPHEKLFTIRVDPGRNRVRQEVHAWKLAQEASAVPPDPEIRLPRPDPERAFRIGWVRVEEEVARLTEKYRQNGQARLEEEIRTIEDYYRQLIDEEKRIKEQRTTRRGREESEGRIELLKLEWDRRIAEENRRLSPEVSVTLSCALCLHYPLERWRGRPAPGVRGHVTDFWVDMHSGEAWPARPLRRKARPAAPPE